MRMQQHRLRPTFNRRSTKVQDNQQLFRNVETQIAANINLGALLSGNKLVIAEEFRRNMPSPLRIVQDFESTADRMLLLRKKLSPMRRVKEEEKRTNCSMDKMRESAVHKATFLNIERLQLVRMYS
jgi:hypothetical protein